MNAKSNAPVAKKPEASAKVAQPKDAVAPNTTEAKKPQLPVATEGSKFQALPPVVKLERVAEGTQEQPAPALIKGVAARPQKGKPQLKMLRKISWIGKHPGTALRIKRWHMYKLGMTLQHCKETEGLSELDVLFWVEHGLMRLQDATEAEFKAATEAWQKSNEAKKTA